MSLSHNSLSPSELQELLPLLTPRELAELDKLILSDSRKWSPLAGPQSDAYYSPADITFYGGAAGGGKTDLACGLACNGEFRRVLILRREGTQLNAIIDRIEDIMGNRDGYNGQSNIWRRGDGGFIQLAGVPHLANIKRFQGQPKGLYVFDEVTEFIEKQFRFITGWLRSEDQTARKRILCTFNPPTTVEGRWVLRMIDAWINPNHNNPAEYGELRWFTTIDGVDKEVDGPGPYQVNGEEIYALSRTFIPAKVQDNPYYMASGYMTVLQALPEPLRSQMLHGDMRSGMMDDEFQVIPSSWVDVAMKRWRPRIDKLRMTGMGVDVARGGMDKTIIITKHVPLDSSLDAYKEPTHGPWFDEIQRFPGEATPDGNAVVSHIVKCRRDAAPIHLDVVGVGSSPYDLLVGHGMQAIAVSGGTRTGAVSVEGHLPFANYKSELWWRVREALSPEIGCFPELPPDDELREDLCSMTWKMTPRGIQVSTKEEVKEVLGRSPDAGDALTYTMIETLRTADLDRMYEKASGSDIYDPDPYSDEALGL